MPRVVAKMVSRLATTTNQVASRRARANASEAGIAGAMTPVDQDGGSSRLRASKRLSSRPTRHGARARDHPPAQPAGGALLLTDRDDAARVRVDRAGQAVVATTTMRRASGSPPSTTVRDEHARTTASHHLQQPARRSRRSTARRCGAIDPPPAAAPPPTRCRRSARR